MWSHSPKGSNTSSKSEAFLNKFIVKNNLERDKIHKVLDYLGKDY